MDSILKYIIFIFLVEFCEIIYSENNLELADYHSLRDKIISQIFKNYKKHERPEEEKLIQTKVFVNIHILAITSVDVINMAYNADFYLRQEWKDSRLSWNFYEKFKKFNKSVSITSMLDMLWIPDLFFRNGKDGFLYKMTKPNFLLRLSDDGEILYSQKITMRFSCQMHLSNFPMDSQQCDINIGSYGYTLDDLKFVWKPNESVTQAPEMQISEFDTPFNVKIIDCTGNSKTSTGLYSCLKALFVLERQLSSYLVSTYIPAILIVMVSWLSFWINVEAVPARVTIGLLTLLGILTQSKGVSGNLPRVSYIKAIDIYIIACILFVIGSLTEFAVASTYNKRQKHCELDKFVRRILREELYDICDGNEERKTKNRKFSLLNKYIFRRKLKSYFSTSPVVRTATDKRCTILTLENKRRKTQNRITRNHYTDIENFDLSRNDEYKGFLSPNYYMDDVFSSTNDNYNNARRHTTVEDIKDAILKRNSITNNELLTSENNVLNSSELDSYSRFIFPALFLLYNCMYWLYYLVIATDHF